MSWETDLYTAISFDRQTYNTRGEVDEALGQVRGRIASIREKLMQYALMTEPGKLIQRECLEEGQSYLDYIASDVRDALDEYEGLADDEYALSILSARWDDCHKANGYPKPVPADLLNFDKSYIAGDFVKTDPDDPDPYDEGGGDEGGEGIEKQTR